MALWDTISTQCVIYDTSSQFPFYVDFSFMPLIFVFYGFVSAEAITQLI